MIGKIYKAITPYYDQNSQKMAFKGRPALVIAKADEKDVIVLPVSTISYKKNIHPIYDIKIDPAEYPKTNLKKISYVRTHKQTVIHIAELAGEICDLRLEYEELYCKVIEKREEFSKDITEQALG